MKLKTKNIAWRLFEKMEKSKSVYISPDELTLASLIDILKRNLIAVHPHLKFMVIGKVWIMFYFETSWHCLLFWYATENNTWHHVVKGIICIDRTVQFPSNFACNAYYQIWSKCEVSAILKRLSFVFNILMYDIE